MRARAQVYLNDCAAGGQTRFHELPGVAVQPQRGKALIFFPALADGSADSRRARWAGMGRAQCGARVGRA